MWAVRMNAAVPLKKLAFLLLLMMTGACGTLRAQTFDLTHPNRLFGFEGIAQLLREKVTATELAVAAQAFGREGDIKVLTLQRTVPA